MPTLPTPVFRPNLIPTWDLRRFVVQAITVAPEPIDAVAVTKSISPDRPNEDDLYSVRAACGWLTTRKFVRAIRGKHGIPPLFAITDKGLEHFGAPDHVFF